MGRVPFCTKVGLRKGPWTDGEDALLTKYIQLHGHGKWRSMPKKAGLLRCGKSCRLRWMNYLRPDIKRGNITPDEDDLIIKMHSLLGNRWSLIAGRLPGRTDNEIKNYWNTHLSKQLINQGTNPNTHKQLAAPVVKKEPKKERTNIKRKGNGKSKIPVKESEKLKPHKPEPTRIKSLSFFSLSRNSSFEWTSNNTIRGSSNLEDGNDHVDFLSQDRDFGHGSNLECQLHIGASSDHTLETIYDEDFQLPRTEDDQIMLDSFPESLFV